jgi:hypothetical protein
MRVRASRLAQLSRVALFALVGGAAGFVGARLYLSRRFTACQAECARFGMVCSPALHNGQDYCCPVR